jgi:hypothetical protein
MSPLVIIRSNTGKNVSIFSRESTISTMIGKSYDRRRIFVAWMLVE